MKYRVEFDGNESKYAGLVSSRVHVRIADNPYNAVVVSCAYLTLSYPDYKFAVLTKDFKVPGGNVSPWSDYSFVVRISSSDGHLIAFCPVTVCSQAD